MRKLSTLISCLLLCNVAHANIQLSEIQNFNFGTVDTRNVNQIAHSFCVYNSDNSAYRVQIYSSGPQGQFVMTNGISQVVYQIKWSPLGNGGDYQTLSPNVPVNMNNADTKLQDCGGHSNATMQIEIDPAALAAATAGAYSTSLAIVLSPV